MHKYSGRGVVVFTSLAAIIGCKHPNTIVSIVTPDLTVLQSAKEGDTLEWRLMKSDSNEFIVHFIGQGPCGAGIKHVKSSKGLASCKVVKSPADEQIYYRYFIDHDDTKDYPLLPTGPRSCGGCMIEQDPTSDFVVPATTTWQGAQPATIGSVKPITTDGGQVTITCDSTNQITVDGPYNPTTSIYWLPDATVAGWSVTFPAALAPAPAPASPLCVEKTQFNSKNSVCTLLKPLTQPYSFSITTTNCTQPQSFPVPATQ